MPKGSVVGLLGTNGSGKTTLIKCALGLIRPQAGEARLLGEPAWTLSGEAKTRIGYVPQVIGLYPWMKVRHLIDYTAAFYPKWNDTLVARLVGEWSIPLGRPHRAAFGGPATKGGDPAGAGPRAGIAGAGRAGRQSRSAWPGGSSCK